MKVIVTVSPTLAWDIFTLLEPMCTELISGAVLSMMTDLLPEDPLLPAASDWLAAKA
jgi:hypothetical protein